jgi:superfamily II DNA or RNA helicase
MKAASLASSKVSPKRSPLFEQLLPHQRKGALAAARTDGYCLLFEQRVGKTWPAGAVIQLLDACEVFLIVRKTNLESTWLKFCKQHLPEYQVFREFAKYNAHQKAFFKAWGHYDKCIYIVNNESVSSKIIGVFRRAKRKWDSIIIDEAQSLKKRTSRISRLAARLSRIARHRLALTGTPMDDSPIDLWAIFRFVDPELLGDNWGDFEEEYIVPVNIDMSKARGELQRRRMLMALRIRKGKPKMRKDRIDKFHRIIKPFCMRVTKEDVGIERAELEWLPVPIFGHQARSYDQLERHLVLTIGKTTITAPLKITQIGKLQQVTGGFIYDEDHESIDIGRAKLRKLEHLIKRLKSPVAIFCKYRPEIELIKEIVDKYSDRVAVIHGGIKDKKTIKPRTDILLAFQRGELDYVIAQQQTGGVGVDMFRARAGIVYSMSHSWIAFDQMISRLDFLEQTVQAKFFLLFVPGTIDEDIRTAIDEKRSVTQITWDRLRKRRS